MSENIIIPNPERLENVVREISKGGAEKLHILADFDKTLTRAFVDGEEIPSLMSIMRSRDGEYLSGGYAKKAKELYEKYHPIEVDSKIPAEEKKKAMREWWITHFELLINLGLNRKDIEKVVDSGKIKFRDGASDFLDLLKNYSIPLIIMSASGLGGDAISMYLEKENKMSANIYIISNSFEWDKNGKAVGIKEPIIHSLNKDETLVKDFPVFEKIKDRKNVLLLGDSLDDVGMVEGFDYENLIKIGFLNSNIEEKMKFYRKVFDVVITNDSDMYYINDLLKKVIR